MKRGVDRLFPRSAFGRIVLGLASFFCAPFFCLTAIKFIVVRKWPDDWLGWLYYLLVEELLLALATYFTCGLIWAVAMPRWLEKLKEASAKRLGFAIRLYLWGFCVLAGVVVIVVLTRRT